ncbi:unnamed protein product [Symbiodinium natans]|uniref:Uncharacterized protein n=1 Tax=Symbiodinium natans TaxID=878477 RepID=A0A812V5F2_9DINO|nr:unnamed protein product [Symbiodinium natans]
MSTSRSQGAKGLAEAGEEDAAGGPLDRSEVLHTGDIVLLKCSLLEEPGVCRCQAVTKNTAVVDTLFSFSFQFLKVHTPRPGGPFLPCMPPCLSKSSSKYWVTPWSCCLSQINCDEGVGEPEMIAVRAVPSGALLLKLELCPHRSFRKFSFIRGNNDELLGAMQTLEKHRPLESQRSSYAIYGKQHLSGCQTISVEGEMLFQWATLSRAPFTYDAKMRVEARLGHCRIQIPGLDDHYAGWIAASQMGSEKQDKKLHEYLVAPGVDPGLVVCGTFAQLLAQDELQLD